MRRSGASPAERCQRPATHKPNWPQEGTGHNSRNGASKSTGTEKRGGMDAVSKPREQKTPGPARATKAAAAQEAHCSRQGQCNHTQDDRAPTYNRLQHNLLHTGAHGGGVAHRQHQITSLDNETGQRGPQRRQRRLSRCLATTLRPSAAAVLMGKGRRRNQSPHSRHVRENSTVKLSEKSFEKRSSDLPVVDCHVAKRPRHPRRAGHARQNCALRRGQRILWLSLREYLPTGIGAVDSDVSNWDGREVHATTLLLV